MLHSKNVQDAAISGRRLGVIVHQCEPLHLAIGGGQSIYNCKLFSLGLRDEPPDQTDVIYEATSRRPISTNMLAKAGSRKRSEMRVAR